MRNLFNQNQTLKKIVSNPLLTGSGIVFVASFVANLFNYGFNLSMGRMLSVEDYGLLIALTSLLILLSIFQIIFSNLFAKFSAIYTTGKNNEGMTELTSGGGKIVFLFSCVIGLGVVFLSPLIASFLHVDNIAFIFLIALAVFLSLLLAVPIGFFQGQLRFFLTSALTVLQPLTKLVTGLVFVYMGYQIMGALFALVASFLIPLLLGIWILRKRIHFSSTKLSPEFKKEFKKYLYTFFLAGIGMTILTSTDVIFVRHFFEGTTAGQFAALALMGKAIFYLTMPINFVFFPIIAQKIEKKEETRSTIFTAATIVTIVSASAAVFYFLNPMFVISIFFPGEEYKVVAPFLGFFALYIVIYSLMTLFYNFFLSSGKKVVYKFTLAAASLQVALFTLFNDTLYQIIVDMTVVVVLLLLVFVYYYMKNGKD